MVQLFFLNKLLISVVDNAAVADKFSLVKVPHMPVKEKGIGFIVVAQIHGADVAVFGNIQGPDGSCHMNIPAGSGVVAE